MSGAWDADCGAQGAAAGRLKTCCLRADGRAVVAQARRSKIRRRPDFSEAVIDASLPGSHPAGQDGGDLVAAMLVALTHNVSNARTEGFNG